MLLKKGFYLKSYHLKTWAIRKMKWTKENRRCSMVLFPIVVIIHVYLCSFKWSSFYVYHVPSLKVNPPITISQWHYKGTSHVGYQSFSMLYSTLHLQYAAALFEENVQLWGSQKTITIYCKTRTRYLLDSFLGAAKTKTQIECTPFCRHKQTTQ